MTTKKATTRKITTSSAKVERASKGDGREGSISFVARKLIKCGKTNDEVFDALVKQFGRKRMPEKHRSDPQWYRRQLDATGTIARDWADEHA